MNGFNISSLIAKSEIPAFERIFSGILYFNEMFRTVRNDPFWYPNDDIYVSELPELGLG